MELFFIVAAVMIVLMPLSVMAIVSKWDNAAINAQIEDQTAIDENLIEFESDSLYGTNH